MNPDSELLCFMIRKDKMQEIEIVCITQLRKKWR